VVGLRNFEIIKVAGVRNIKVKIAATRDISVIFAYHIKKNILLM
jgi:hypothetical protein